MSHHFDTKLSKEDPSLNVCDFYLFQGTPETTVMAMTVNPDVGLSASDILHEEGLYGFRFDLDGDAREEVAFKLQFGPPEHGGGDEHVHVQSFQVRRSTGAAAVQGAGGDMLLEGKTGAIAQKNGVRVFVGTVADMFAGDAFAIGGFLKAYKEKRYSPEVWEHHVNYFANRNITAIVLEVPNHMIGKKKVGAWATASLHGHAPEMQVSRWGIPMYTHIFLSESEELRQQFNSSVPSQDVALFAKPVSEFATTFATYANSAVDPAEYGQQIVRRLIPTTLPYEIGTPAAFDFGGFNGRGLGDDAMDVMITLAANKPLADGVEPDRKRIRPDFPYFGMAYSKEEQNGVVPVPKPAKY